ncbi:MAG: AAA family ATPase [Candidatus Omnitrophica bacterium]|nr:AAA family ATPase [Candidatus Omnitrophota bacterium]
MKNKVHKIFISATGQNDGKTSVSLGLICALKERFQKVGFIKPVGQRYLVEQGHKVDEDSVLIEKVCGIECKIQDMSPIAIEKGFTKKYILKGSNKELTKKIKNSFEAVSKDKDLVVIEGTGHAGVGSVFGLSNAAVAKLLDSKVVIVASGGIGRPIDEIMLSKALFEKEKVEVIGAIINKVKADKYEKVNKIVRMGLKKRGLKVLGVIPYVRSLSEPTVGQVLEELGFELLAGKNGIGVYIDKILVGAMAPHDALSYFSDRCLVITPGDREDLILAVVGFQMDRAKEGLKIAGIVLTGGIKPHQTIIDLVRRAQIPLLLAKADTYSVASSVHDLTVKIKPEDCQKTRMAKDIVEKYVDIEMLLKQL